MKCLCENKNSKVGPGMQWIAYQYITAFDIAVHDFVLVEVRQPLRGLLCVDRRDVLAEGPELR